MLVLSPSGTLCEVSDEFGSRLLDSGWQLIGESAQTPQSPTQPDEEEIPAEDPTKQRPAKSASRGVWAAYAKTLGLSVDGLTRAQILDLIGD